MSLRSNNGSRPWPETGTDDLGAKLSHTGARVRVVERSFGPTVPLGLVCGGYGRRKGSLEMGHVLMDVAVPFPIPYQGSKRKLAPAILNCFPTGVNALYEPFCGSAAVSLAALTRGMVTRGHFNDTNAPLIEVWRCIAEDPEAIASGYEKLWHEQAGQEAEFYVKVRSQFNRTHEPALLLYLLARCVKAAVRYNAAGEFNQSPDNRRSGTRPDRMRRRIFEASAVCNGRVRFSSTDYARAIEDAKPSDLIYMDPPYQGVSTSRDRRYMGGIDHDEFVETLGGLNERGISYILSYDGSLGTKKYGQVLPSWLNLSHHGVDAGRSSQATLLGRDDRTVESLYLSPALVERLGSIPAHLRFTSDEREPTLFARATS